MINNAPNNKNYHQGNFIPNDLTKVIKLNEKGGLYYRSGWEKKLYIYMDANPKIKNYGAEFIAIPYTLTHFDNGIPYQKNHRYFPDLYYELTREDGSIKKVLAEIKPYKECCKPSIPLKGTKKQIERFKYDLDMWNRNMAKWNQAIQYCSNRGIEFVIITEKYLDMISG